MRTRDAEIAQRMVIEKREFAYGAAGFRKTSDLLTDGHCLAPLVAEYLLALMPNMYAFDCMEGIRQSQTESEMLIRRHKETLWRQSGVVLAKFGYMNVV
jgi:hypothetical protein